MEFDQIAHKILLNQRIPDSRQNSRGVRELVLKLIDFTMGMTRDELMRFMLESMAPALQQAMDDRDASQQKVAEMSRELEEEKDARKKAEKSTADKDREIAALKKALEDERNKNKTHVRNSFGRQSRKSRNAAGGGINKADRTREKNDFDATQTNGQSDTNCIIRSIIETCKLWGVSVYEYLLKICRAFAMGRTDYDNLMPWCMTSSC